MISRRKALIGGAVALLAMPYVSKAQQFFNLQRLQHGSIYSKKKSLVIVGASVEWGLGNDQTQQYAYYLQQMIDSRLSTPLGGWVARYVHTDDIQAGTSCTTAPFNADVSDEGPNWGTGSYTTASPLVWSNASGSIIAPSYAGSSAPANLNPTIGGTQGSAKLNTTSAPTQGNAGIFSNFDAGSKTVACASQTPPNIRGAYTNPMLRLDTANQFVRFGINSPMGNQIFQLYLGLVGAGPGVAHIFSTWGGATPITVSITNTTALDIFGIDFTLTSSSSTANVIYPAVAWGAAPVGLNGLSIYAVSGRVDTALIWPAALQASNHILVQSCSRDSYAIQDYLGNDTSTSTPTFGTGTGSPITTLIAQGVLNSYVNFPSVCDPPIFLIFDSYNSMLQNFGRGLTPSQYYTDLGTLGTQLVSGAGGTANVILTMPNPPNGSPVVTGYDWNDYEVQIRALANAEGWGFVGSTCSTPNCPIVNQATLPSLPSIYANGGGARYGFYPDNIHPDQNMTQFMARQLIDALGL